MSRDLTIPQSAKLPDNRQWTNRFQVNGHTIAQHKKGRYWGCDCQQWIRHGYCLDLHELHLPGSRKPYEPHIEVIQ